MSSNVDLHLSALIDGELDAAEYDNIIKHLKADIVLKDKWTKYHLISDAMKINLPSVVDHDLGSRIQKALETEPTLLVPTSQMQSKPKKPDQRPAAGKQTAAVAGPTSFGSKGYAIAASVLVVSALGFMLMSEPEQNLVPSSAMTVTAPQPVPVATVASTIVPVVNSSPVEVPSVIMPLAKAPAASLDEPKNIQPVARSDVSPRIFIDHTFDQDDRWDRIRVMPQLDPGIFPFARVGVVNFEDNNNTE